MSNKIGFVLGATDHGPMIVSRHDYHGKPESGFYGVGHQLLETGTFDPDEVALLLSTIPREPGTLVLDIGANIGAMTLPIAKHLRGIGAVIAFEPQDRIYYALAGNIALNNCWNARAVHAAVADKSGVMMVPRLDYENAASYASLELKSWSEDIGQRPTEAYPVMAVSIDQMNLASVAFMKIDVEGMELDVLNGAIETIKKHRPAMLVEYVKCGLDKLLAWLDQAQYDFKEHGINLLCCPRPGK